MYLKSLVLKGFKSFADRSVLTFQPGISAIVGPNGSGKSNISDAVLWVLGERNAKHLRGQVMEDVIFSGSSARKSVGVAEVSLVLDNSDGALPVDYTEVALTRRIFRNGESDYLINGAVARRMDFLDILHDSGLGTGTHSIISQGNLDSILQSKPEDRRALIEEAAGVLKHKQRKEKSARKLAGMEQHVARVRDVVGEIERQLGPLERKAKRAQTYIDVSSQLADVNLRLTVDDLRLLKQEFSALEEREENLQTNSEEKQLAISAAEEASAAIQKQLQDQSNSIGGSAATLRRAVAANASFQSHTTVFDNRHSSALQRVSELSERIASDKEALQASIAQKAVSTSALSEAALHHSEALHQVDETGEALRSARMALKDAQHALDELTALQNARQTELFNLQDALSKAHANAQKHEVQCEFLRTQISNTEKELVEVQLTKEQADSALAEAFEQRESAIVFEENAKANDEGSRNALVQAQQAAKEAVSALAEARARVNGLRQIQQATLALGGAAREWLRTHNETTRDAKSAAAVLNAHPAYEALVDALLGEDALTLLIHDSSRIAEIGGALSAALQRGEDASGRASFAVNLQREAVVTSPAQRYCENHEGVALISEVSADEEYLFAARALLGDVVVCDSLQACMSAAEQAKENLRFVTRSGDVVTSAGLVYLGAAKSERSMGALELKRNLEDATQALTGAQEAHDKAQEALASAQTAQANAAEQLRLAQRAAAERSAEVKSAEQRAQAAAVKATQLETTLAKAQENLRELEERAQNATDLSPADIRIQIEHAESDLLALKADAARGTEALEKARIAYSTAGSQNNTAKIEEAKAAAQKRYAQQQFDTLQTSEQDYRSALSRSNEMLAVQRVVAQRALETAHVFEKLKELIAAPIARLEDLSRAVQDASTELMAKSQESLLATKKAHEAYNAVLEQLNALRVEKGRLEVRVDAAVSTIQDVMGVSLEVALEMPDLENREEALAQQAQLERRIRNLGTINPDAAKEYAELKERYDYLVAQLNDLDAAKTSLVRIDHIIDERMKNDFVRTFETVNQNFKDIFSVLFPGGQGELLLVDPTDLEHTGVEVTAQPKGKRVTKMMLMSGGEKSLIALALLFAVYKTRSTPFYILDEVEAALDDTNLRRLTSYLEELRTSTQLLMITHQRRTMEMSDTLFGVSMQADGVSKVISQKLERALEYAED